MTTASNKAIRAPEDNSSNRIAVIMSTYNSQLDHLRVQMDSVMSQTVRPSVYVRDDGSDEGPAIDFLSDLASEGAIAFERGENLGFTRSFLSALAMAKDEEYFAFCDQDDKWLPHKLEYAIEALDGRGAQAPGSAPFLYFSHYIFCDRDLNPVSDQAPHPKGPSFQNALVDALAFGMVCVVNRSLANEMISANHTLLAGHDWWAYLVASGIGEVIEDKRVTNLYRRTEMSVTTAGTAIFKQTVFRIRTMLFGDGLKQVQTMHHEYYRLYARRLRKEDRRLLELFMPKHRLRKALLKICYSKPYRQNTIDELSCRMMFLFGRL